MGRLQSGCQLADGLDPPHPEETLKKDPGPGRGKLVGAAAAAYSVVRDPHRHAPARAQAAAAAIAMGTGHGGRRAAPPSAMRGLEAEGRNAAPHLGWTRLMGQMSAKQRRKFVETGYTALQFQKKGPIFISV